MVKFTGEMLAFPSISNLNQILIKLYKETDKIKIKKILETLNAAVNTYCYDESIGSELKISTTMKLTEILMELSNKLKDVWIYQQLYILRNYLIQDLSYIPVLRDTMGRALITANILSQILAFDDSIVIKEFIIDQHDPTYHSTISINYNTLLTSIGAFEVAFYVLDRFHQTTVNKWINKIMHFQELLQQMIRSIDFNLFLSNYPKDRKEHRYKSLERYVHGYIKANIIVRRLFYLFGPSYFEQSSYPALSNHVITSKDDLKYIKEKVDAIQEENSPLFKDFATSISAVLHDMELYIQQTEYYLNFQNTRILLPEMIEVTESILSNLIGKGTEDLLQSYDADMVFEQIEILLGITIMEAEKNDDIRIFKKFLHRLEELTQVSIQDNPSYHIILFLAKFRMFRHFNLNDFEPSKELTKILNSKSIQIRDRFALEMLQSVLNNESLNIISDGKYNEYSLQHLLVHYNQFLTKTSVDKKCYFNFIDLRSWVVELDNYIPLNCNFFMLDN
ncbi:MAG: hypothetical protein INQ03_17265 [Candidatus Heimdallarchaeota archaeon]|nr:hypothetical protein [Candidatus Heimdallarchaeota archaeon]